MIRPEAGDPIPKPYTPTLHNPLLQTSQESYAPLRPSLIQGVSESLMLLERLYYYGF